MALGDLVRVRAARAPSPARCGVRRRDRGFLGPRVHRSDQGPPIRAAAIGLERAPRSNALVAWQFRGVVFEASQDEPGVRRARHLPAENPHVS